MDYDLIQHKNEKIQIAAVIVCLVFIVLISLFVFTKNHHIKTDDIKNQVAQVAFVPEVPKIDPFANISIGAKSAVVWDVKNKKVLYAKNEQDVLPLASLTKLMTALVATEILPEQSTVRITAEYLSEEGPAELLRDERWGLQDLIALTLVSSSNAGARAIATVAGAALPQPQYLENDPRQLFIDYLNKRASELNLNSFRFYNDNGLDVNLEKSGAYGNASDVARLVDYILKEQPALLEATKYSKFSIDSANGITHDLKNTNVIIENIPGIIGSKTGFTDLAQGNLVVAFSPGLEGPYIAVVLDSSFGGRFTDMSNLVHATVQKIGQ